MNMEKRGIWRENNGLLSSLSGKCDSGEGGGERGIRMQRKVEERYHLQT